MNLHFISLEQAFFFFGKHKQIDMIMSEHSESGQKKIVYAQNISTKAKKHEICERKERN